MAARTLGPRELNRALLARQGLLERFSAAVPRVLERVGGIQAQYAPAMYVGLWSRTAGFTRDELTRRLERRTAVQATLQRATIHLVAPGDFWPIAIAVRDARRRQWLTVEKGATAADHARAAAVVEEALRAAPDGALSRGELDALVGKREVIGASYWVDLVRAPPSGTWERRRADRYALAAQWVGPEPEDLDRVDAVAHLVRRYLQGFGPASRKEVASFCGLPQRDVVPALARLEPLRRFRADDGEELLDLPRLALPPAEVEAPVRFLPNWDATLLVHARRRGLIREADRPRIFQTTNPQSEATVLVDGVVEGTWRFDGERVVVDPWRRFAAAERSAIDAEAERLAAFHLGA